MYYFQIVLLALTSYLTIISCDEGGEGIIQKNNIIKCRDLTCPQNTRTCMASEKTNDDLTEITYVRECRDAEGNKNN